MTQLTAPPGFRPHEARFAKEHLTYQAREARRDKLVARGSLVLNIVFGGALLAAAYGAAAVLPMVRLVPVFIHVADDGTVHTALTTDQQPPDLNHTQLKAWLWQYVIAHDSYALGALNWNIDVVRGMSTPEVFKAWHAYADPKNPNSMAAKLGTRGWVTLKRDMGDLRLNSDGTGQFRVTYYRLQEEIGRPRIITHWQQDITFTQGYVVPRKEAETFNPSAITITDYPPPDAIGAEPGMPLAAAGATP